MFEALREVASSMGEARAELLSGKASSRAELLSGKPLTRAELLAPKPPPANVLPEGESSDDWVRAAIAAAAVERDLGRADAAVQRSVADAIKPARASGPLSIPLKSLLPPPPSYPGRLDQPVPGDDRLETPALSDSGRPLRIGTMSRGKAQDEISAVLGDYTVQLSSHAVVAAAADEVRPQVASLDDWLDDLDSDVEELSSVVKMPPRSILSTCSGPSSVGTQQWALSSGHPASLSGALPSPSALMSAGSTDLGQHSASGGALSNDMMEAARRIAHGGAAH